MACFFFHSATVCKFLTRMRNNLTLMSTWHGVMVDEEKFIQWKISTNTVYNTLKMDTKYLHSVCARHRLKDEEHFWNGLVHKPYKRSLYERAFMSELNLSSQNMLSNVNQEKHKLKSHCVCRRGHEPSRIAIRILKSLRPRSNAVLHMSKTQFNQ